MSIRSIRGLESLRDAVASRNTMSLLSLMLTQGAIITWAFALWLLGEQAGVTQRFILHDGAFASPLGWLVMGFVLMAAAKRLDQMISVQEARVENPDYRGRQDRY